MKITNIDSFIEEFRNGRDKWSRTAIELVVREIERLRNETHKLKVRLAASENDLVLFEVSEMLKKTQARVQELEEECAGILTVLDEIIGEAKLQDPFSDEAGKAMLYGAEILLSKFLPQPPKDGE